MKKFMKVCGITALVMLGISLVCILISTAFGGNKLIREAALRGELSFGNEDISIFDFTDKLEEIDASGIWHFNTYDFDESTMFNNSYNIISSGKVDESFAVSDISELEIELGGCDVRIKEIDGAYITVKAEKFTSFQTYLDNGTLYVRGVDHVVGAGLSTMKVEIGIPKGSSFDGMDMQLGAGKAEFSTLDVNELNMEVGAGQIIIDKLAANNATLSVGAGEIIVNNGVINDAVSMECGMGNLTYEGNIIGDLDAECAMGNVEIEITGSTEKDHNYELDCAAGNMRVGNMEYSGIGSERSINNGASSTFSLECTMGNLEVVFR